MSKFALLLIRAPRYVLLAVLAVIVGLLVGFLPLLFLQPKPASALTMPPDFADALVANVDSPTALAFTPDGRLLVASQGGVLRVYENGMLLTRPALDLTSQVCTNAGRGLLGVAVDPNFATNNYIYLYYTFKKYPGCGQNTANLPVNRVVRYVLTDSNTATFDQILVNNMQNVSLHSAGDLHFGKDGYLYVSVGDGGCYYADFTQCAAENKTAQDKNVLMGKILRVTRDGGIPATNPYQGSDSTRCNLTGRTDPGKKCQEIFASGLRNPFRLAFDPNASGTRFFINDVGAGTWEEVNVGRSGANYGWPICEGGHDNPKRAGSADCTAAPYTPPIHEYNHSTGCSSITGGAFVPDGAWPAKYDGSYLYGDYVCGKIFKLTPDGSGGFTRTNFVTGLGSSSATTMTFGPLGGGKTGRALYYATYNNGGQVRSLAYNGAATNRPPAAAVATTPTPAAGPLPLAVTFDGSGSTDPDSGDTLSYLWDFGDGSPTETTTTPTTSHTYSTEGTYTATLRVRDNHGALSEPDTVRIDAGNEAPNPVIGSPSADLLFEVGEQITLSGSATDPEDGSLAGTSFVWEVLQHHNGTHTHPFFSGTGNDLTFPAPEPEDLDSTGAGNYLEIKLTATDSKGLSRTVTRNIEPHRVGITFETEPNSTLRLGIEGASVNAPTTLTSWKGHELNVTAPSPQTTTGMIYEFASWSDGGGQSHVVVTGAEPAIYTATYTGTADTTAPETRISSGPSGNVNRRGAQFSFSSSEAGSTFQCRIEGSTFSLCTSPKSYSKLSQGSHNFRVRAIDQAGNIDATPATRSWFVDTVVPKGKISIDGGAASTASRTVKLTLSARDPSPASGVASMRFRNGGTTTWSSWFDYSASKLWTLSAKAGKKRVNVQYRDRAGNISALAYDTIRFSP